jgi:signal transduction histidine kinase
MKETLYRIAQEALHNTIKHAQASRVALNLDCDADAIRMEIRDDGKGFQADASYPGHLGLRSMRERAERLGGELNVESSPDSGTHIRVRIPLAPAPAEGAVP